MIFPPVVRIAPVPLDVVIVPGQPYDVERKARTANVLVTQAVVSAVPCALDQIFGYNSDPGAGILYVQLHDKAVAVVLGDAPFVIIPVPSGGKVPYSLAAETIFAVGLVVAISTTELTFTPPAANYLNFNVNYRTAT